MNTEVSTYIYIYIYILYIHIIYTYIITTYVFIFIIMLFPQIYLARVNFGKNVGTFRETVLGRVRQMEFPKEFDDRVWRLQHANAVSTVSSKRFVLAYRLTISLNRAAGPSRISSQTVLNIFI